MVLNCIIESHWFFDFLLIQSLLSDATSLSVSVDLICQNFDLIDGIVIISFLSII